MTIKEILEYTIVSIGNFNLSLYHIIAALGVIAIAHLLAVVVSKVLKRFFSKRQVDQGRLFAIVQVAKYIIYTSAVLIAIEAMGFSLSILLGGAAALMVGVGLGLQQTFNDLVSGIILLVEGSVSRGDIMEVDGIIGVVTHIGIRTSQLETRKRISIVIPNSLLVNDKTINWSHSKEPARFDIDVGVAYSSDINLVTKILLEAASKHKDSLKDPEPRVQFKGFGNSSLDFVLMFFSYNYLSIEFVKSDIRYEIIKLFRESGVEIPFPQQDLWLRNPETLGSKKNIEKKDELPEA